jgi:hypothetical protein
MNCENNECSFYAGGKCKILSEEANDKIGRCRFFKTKEQLADEWVKCNKRLQSLKRE